MLCVQGIEKPKLRNRLAKLMSGRPMSADGSRDSTFSNRDIPNDSTLKLPAQSSG